MTADSHLADNLASCLAGVGAASASRLARRVRARKSDVLRVLHGEDRFELIGRGRSSLWLLTETSEAGNRQGTGQELHQGDEATWPIHGVLDHLQAIEARLDALDRRTGSTTA
jgi:hypothetical protein